jgi:hypothetical protein
MRLRGFFMLLSHILSRSRSVITVRRLFGTVPSSRLKASFQYSECSLEERKKLGSSHCQWTISVGYPAHEDDRLLSTAVLINKTFGKCTLMLDDSLQWRTLKLQYPDKSKQDLIKIAIENGDSWLERNLAVYSSLNIPLNIVRWKDLISLPQFTVALAEMERDCLENPIVSNAIELTINDFLSRAKNNNIILNNKLSLDEARALCRDYLIEEGAMVRRVWPTYIHADYEVYPSKRSPLLELIYTSFIRPCYGDLLKPVSLRFNRRNRESIREEGDTQGNEQQQNSFRS